MLSVVTDAQAHDGLRLDLDELADVTGIRYLTFDHHSARSSRPVRTGPPAEHAGCNQDICHDHGVHGARVPRHLCPAEVRCGNSDSRLIQVPP